MGKIRNSNELAVIRNRIATYITNINSNMDVQQGHVIKDLVVDAPGQEFRYAYVLLDYVNTIKSLTGISSLLSDTGFKSDIQAALDLDTTTDVDNLISADIDDLASVFGVTRKPAVAAKYMQRFYRTDSNSGNALTIPIGTTVKTSDNTVIATVTASAPQIPILDGATGLYYVEEVVAVTVAGSTGNLAAGTLKQMAPQISQASSTSNTVLLTSGVDEETDSALIDRLETARKGRNLQTTAGWLNIALGTAEDSPLSFQDALVIDPSNALMTRAYAGAIDIYTVGKNVQTVQEKIYHTGGGATYTLGFQPVESVISVVGSLTGNFPTFVTYLDTTSAVAGSTHATSAIEVPGGTVGEALTVTYRIDQAIVDAQRLVDSDDNFTIPGTDVLFRQGIQATINVDIQVFYYGARAQAAVQTDIQNDLAAFFDGGATSNNAPKTAKKLGEDIDWSDVLAIITAVDDVDRVTLTGTNGIKFYKDAVQVTDDPISIADNQYARLGTVTFI